MGDRRYQDAEFLHEKYHGENLTAQEIADLCDVSHSTIVRWMNKLDIETRSSKESRELRGTGDNQFGGGPHRDEDWLREKYHDEHMTVAEMADAAGVTDATIIRNMDRHDIGRRPNYVSRILRNPGAGFVAADARGYETIKHSVDDHTYNYPIHRLVAIAKYGYDAVSESVVHHKNGIEWDNRPENLELFDDQAAHARHHGEERGGLNG